MEADNNENRMGCISHIKFVVPDFEFWGFVESFVYELFITPVLSLMSN